MHLNMDSKVERWTRNPIFAAAGEEICRQLARQHPGTVHPPGTEVAQAGAAVDRLHVLLRGTVKVFHRTPDGREAVVRLMRAPAVFGDVELLQGLPMLENVESIDEIELAAVPGGQYLQLLSQSPGAMLEHLRSLAGARCVASRNERQVFTTLEQRMANLLLSYADYFGQEGPDGELVIRCHLTRPAIARSLGTVRRTVVKMIAQWTERGLVTRRGAYTVLLQPEVLEQIAAPIRGSLCYEIGTSLEHLARKDRLEEGEVELLGGPGSLAGRRFSVGEDLLVGRSTIATLRLPDPYLCLRHCRIFRSATGCRFWIMDLDSINGTYVNGERIQRAVLHDGDRIRVGSSELRFRLLPAAPEADELERSAA